MSKTLGEKTQSRLTCSQADDLDILYFIWFNEFHCYAYATMMLCSVPDVASVQSINSHLILHTTHMPAQWCILLDSIPPVKLYEALSTYTTIPVSNFIQHHYEPMAQWVISEADRNRFVPVGPQLMDLDYKCK